MRIDTSTDSERELRPRGSLNHFMGFFWPIIVLWQLLSSYLVYLRVLPCVHVQLLAKTDSSEEANG